MRENNEVERTVLAVGIVVIGRNEGERLRTCLNSLDSAVYPVVYVDSGSTDDSVSLARRAGLSVVELDAAKPFTAARARNAGFKKLIETAPDTGVVQFVDGDCELFENWLTIASAAMKEQPDVAVVCGRLYERYPNKSVYNRLCDMEWNTPVGETKSSGGIAMMRARAFRECGGFDEELIAGEEPQLCFQMRSNGWKILRINADMGWHDAAMTSFWQWWRRNIRAGHAYAEGSRRLGNAPERFWVHETRSIGFWGLAVPAIVAAFAWPTGLWSLGLLLGYPLLAARVYGATRRRGFSQAESLLYAFFSTLGKLPQAWGVSKYYGRVMAGQPRLLIEYK